MNLYDSSFLALDIGTSGVHGIAHRVRAGRIDRSAVFSTESYDTVFAIKSVVDELERQIGTRFDTAYVTGNFGESRFDMTVKNTVWNGEHKITPADIRTQVAGITPPDGFFPMHIVPLRYDAPGARNIRNPIGHTDRQLISAFGAIFYSRKRMDKIGAYLRRAHIQPEAFYDPHFLQSASFRKNGKPAMFITIGAEFTAASIWTARGPVFHSRIARGGTDITRELSAALSIDFDEAERIKRGVVSMVPNEMNRFTPADAAYAFSHADVNDIAVPILTDMITSIRDASATAFEKYRPEKIYLSGGISDADGVADYIAGTFGVPTERLHADANVRALAQYVWDAEAAHRNAFIARRERWHNRFGWLRRTFGRRRTARPRFIPILPSTLCFNMKSPLTYSMFASAGLSMVHVDIMDGFYVDKIAGGIEQLKFIRAHTRAHLHVHLMTESPSVWAADAVAAGADTVIVSTNTSGVRNALRLIRAAHKRAGIALNVDSDVKILRPVLREIDEVMVMTVAPGAAGQTFHPECLNKISALAAVRKKYGLKFTISVDGGINANTAKMCWDAGADLLVSGSYLARSSDFPLAVQSLLKKS